MAVPATVSKARLPGPAAASLAHTVEAATSDNHDGLHHPVPCQGYCGFALLHNGLGKRPGQQAAALDAMGAAIGRFGLLAFAAIMWTLPGPWGPF